MASAADRAAALSRLRASTAASDEPPESMLRLEMHSFRSSDKMPPELVSAMTEQQSKEGVRVAAPDMPAKSADLRPRLSLSCHGDQADPTLVFKSKAATTLRRAGEGAARNALSRDGEVDAETAGDNFDEAHNRGKVNAPWPKDLKDVSWLEGAKLDDVDWGHKR